MQQSELKFEELNNRIKELETRNAILEAQTPYTLMESHREISKASEDNYMGSAVIISIKNINKNQKYIIRDTSISNGLSKDTIEAIKRDILKSYKYKLEIPNGILTAK